MQETSIETRFGPVPLWGRFDSFLVGRPLVLVIRGILGLQDQLVSLADRLPEADVALAHLPGMHTAPLAANSVGSYSAAFDEVLGSLGRPALVLGVSLGGTVALGLRSPLVRRMIVLDPPMNSASLKPMVGELRKFATRSPEMARWVRDVTGVHADGIDDLDFRGLTNGLAAPCLAMLGSDLEGDGRFPSFVGPEERAFLERHPAITTRIVVGVGHNIPLDGIGAMMWAVRLAAGAIDTEASDSSPRG